MTDNFFRKVEISFLITFTNFTSFFLFFLTTTEILNDKNDDFRQISSYFIYLILQEEIHYTFLLQSSLNSRKFFGYCIGHALRNFNTYTLFSETNLICI